MVNDTHTRRRRRLELVLIGLSRVTVNAVEFIINVQLTLPAC